MKNETDEEFRRRIMREAAVSSVGFRCGECSRIAYYRETEQWECGGSYCNPSSRACGLFRPCKGRPVDGTFPAGEGPNFGPARDNALKTSRRSPRSMRRTPSPNQNPCVARRFSPTSTLS